MAMSAPSGAIRRTWMRTSLVRSVPSKLSNLAAWVRIEKF